MVKNLELNPFQRASLYVSIHVLFERLAAKEGIPVEVRELLESVGVELPSFTDEELEYISKYLNTFRAADVRLDLRPEVNAHLHLHIKSFISAAGYTAPEPVDSLTSMTAFVARLAIDIYTAQLTNSEKAQKLERILHRFLKTHLIPTLTQTKCKTLTKTIHSITTVLEKDCETLLKQFTKPT